MRVRVKLFANLRRVLHEAPPGTPFDAHLSDQATVDDLIGHLALSRDEVKVIFVNGRSRPLNWALAEGDEVGMFPLVGGG